MLTLTIYKLSKIQDKTFINTGLLVFIIESKKRNYEHN